MTTPGSEQAYNQCHDAIMALDKDQISYCNIPIEVAVAEATQLAVAAVEDKDTLMGSGMDEQMLRSLPARAGALAYSAARYQMTIEKDPEAAKLWKEEYPAGYELRKYLVKNMSFAYRKNERLTASMKKIKDGRGHKDMVLDLLALSMLAEENTALLAKMPMFDRNKIEEARQMNYRLNQLLAQTDIGPDAVNAAKDTYHRAWTYYKLVGDEVKEHGQFLFEGTDKYQRYISNYLQSVRKNTSETAAQASNL